jgi:hypothetical protein
MKTLNLATQFNTYHGKGNAAVARINMWAAVGGMGSTRWEES